MTSSLTASSFSSSTLEATATSSAQLYQRSATNPIDSSTSTAINIGQLVTNQSQLDVNSLVQAQNPNDYYQFNLQGSSIKLALNNLTNTSDLRVQIINSSGTVLADSSGTAAQQLAYDQASSLTGLAATSGNYTVKVSFAPTALQSLSQNYSLQLYSGTQFNTSYQTNAAVQTSQTSYLPVDNTLSFASSTAQLYSRQAYNQINSTAQSSINIGWLSANTTQLNVSSQVTSADQADFYKFTFQQGNSLKLAFNDTTDTSNLRVQLLNVVGTQVLADNQGTAAQQAAYADLTSSTGLTARTGQYVVKVSYAQGAKKTQAQNYNFQLTSGSVYTSSYQTIASAQTYANGLLTGTVKGAFNPMAAAASYLNSASQGNTPDLFTTLSTINPVSATASYISSSSSNTEPVISNSVSSLV